MGVSTSKIFLKEEGRGEYRGLEVLLAWAQGFASRWGLRSIAHWQLIHAWTHPSQAGRGSEGEDGPAHDRGLDLRTFKSPFQPKFFNPRHHAWNKRLSLRIPTPWWVLAPHLGSWVAKEVSVTATPCASGHCRELEPTLALPEIPCSSWIPFFLPSDGGNHSQLQLWQVSHITLRSFISPSDSNVFFIKKIPSQLCFQRLQSALARSAPVTGVSLSTAWFASSCPHQSPPEERCWLWVLLLNPHQI